MLNGCSSCICEPYRIDLKIKKYKDCSLTHSFFSLQEPTPRRKIRLIEINAKCRHLKKLFVKELCGRCLDVQGHLPSKVLFGVVKQFCRF
jgi:hypothetical protein